MKRSGNYLIFFLILILLVVNGMYFGYIRSLVPLAYAGKAPAWFNSVIDFLYPRFLVERQRFELSFFLNKADQIVVRLSFIVSIVILFSFLYIRSEKFKHQISRFWNRSVSGKQIDLLRILFYSLMILIFKDIYWDLMTWGKAEAFYKPIFIYRIFNIPFPSDTGALLIYCLLLLSCIACIFNFYPGTFTVLAIFVFIFIQGLIFSFEKTDHGFAPYTYAGLLMPFLIYENNLAKKKHSPQTPGWALQLIVLVIALCYLFSGLEKLLISNFQWANPSTFKAYLHLHETSIGTKVAESDLLCTLLPILTLVLQIGFISCVFNRKLRWIFIPAALLFHVSTYLLFNVGGFTNPWILVLIFFVDWERVLSAIQRRIE